MTQPFNCLSIAFLISILSYLPIFAICSPTDPQPSHGIARTGNSSLPYPATPNRQPPLRLATSPTSPTPPTRPVYVSFTIDRSKTVARPNSDIRIPKTSVEIKLGPSRRLSNAPATTQLDIHQYSSSAVTRPPGFWFFAARMTESSNPINSFFEETLGQEQHVNEYITNVGFRMGYTSMTNDDLASRADGHGVFTWIISRNRRVQRTNTVANILRNIIGIMGVVADPSPANANTQILSYFNRASLYEIIENNFPTRPIPLLVRRSGAPGSFEHLFYSVLNPASPFQINIRRSPLALASFIRALARNAVFNNFGAVDEPSSPASGSPDSSNSSTQASSPGSL